MQIGEIPGAHAILFAVNVQLDRRQLHHLDPFIEEDLRDGTARKDKEINVGPPLSNPGDYGQGPEGMP
jgi:hypothetical protein